MSKLPRLQRLELKEGKKSERPILYPVYEIYQL
jgi:hypothetical protein